MADSVFDGPRLTKRDFDTLASLIEKHAGIQMPDNKRTMLEGRLRRRLKERKMESFAQYCRYLFEEGGLDEELISLIDVVTTNKTEFFRESDHFDFLIQTVVPSLIERGIGIQRPLMVWSAGCSTGPEPYTLAMALSEIKIGTPSFQFHILGTDISTHVLRAARKAIYTEDMVEPIPMILRKRYLLRSIDRSARRIRIAPEIRGFVEFRRLNFMDADYHMPVMQDIVFCRNVIIYFNREVRQKVLGRICRHLSSGGYLFVGHAETLGDVDLPIRPSIPTVYQRL
ncbi:Chemotaxis protein methyltransferase [Azospirillaceae bacterium]